MKFGVPRKAMVRAPFGETYRIDKRDIILPLLQQLEGIIDREVIEYLQKPLDELRADIDSADTYLKGLALEAFAIRIMRIIGLDFIQTRLKGTRKRLVPKWMYSLIPVGCSIPDGKYSAKTLTEFHSIRSQKR